MRRARHSFGSTDLVRDELVGVHVCGLHGRLCHPDLAHDPQRVLAVGFRLPAHRLASGRRRFEKWHKILQFPEPDRSAEPHARPLREDRIYRRLLVSSKDIDPGLLLNLDKSLQDVGFGINGVLADDQPITRNEETYIGKEDWA